MEKIIGKDKSDNRMSNLKPTALIVLLDDTSFSEGLKFGVYHESLIAGRGEAIPFSQAVSVAPASRLRVSFALSCRRTNPADRALIAASYATPFESLNANCASA
jgi:hypothetical protein